MSDELDQRVRDLEAERMRPTPRHRNAPDADPEPLSPQRAELNQARLERALAVHASDVLAGSRNVRDDDVIVDEVAVERAADGEHLPLTQAERQAAAELILARGGTVTQVSRLLRVSGATARAMAERAQEAA